MYQLTDIQNPLRIPTDAAGRERVRIRVNDVANISQACLHYRLKLHSTV